MAKKIIPTTFLILSDTHNVNPNKIFAPPNQMPDVLLFCGNLTMSRDQSLSAYEGALSLLAAIPADLKLVIAGNHDIVLDEMTWASLDKNAWSALNRNVTIEGYGDAAYHKEVLDLMTGEKAKKAGIKYLTEGVHTFKLYNGAKLRVYTSPYTPSSPGFEYKSHEDRFNRLDDYKHNGRDERALSVITTFTDNPVPACPDVDVVMTHGPPMGILDTRNGEHLGCRKLSKALSRARPKLHCFGHVQEGYGTGLVEWVLDKDGQVCGIDRTKKSFRGKQGVNAYPDVMKTPGVKWGKETLMVNASLLDSNKISRQPYLLEIDLWAHTQ